MECPRWHWGALRPFPGSPGPAGYAGNRTSGFIRPGRADTAARVVEMDGRTRGGVLRVELLRLLIPTPEGRHSRDRTLRVAKKGSNHTLNSSKVHRGSKKNNWCFFAEKSWPSNGEIVLQFMEKGYAVSLLVHLGAF